MVWPGRDLYEALTVWGDDGQTSEIDGMLPGERMCWRVWDASENTVYTATVVYNPAPPFNSTGLYGTDELYALLSLTPTALKLVSFQAASHPIGSQEAILGAGGFILISAALFLFQRRRI
jgi:hypothetical protein